MKMNSLQKTWRILSPLLIYYLIKNIALFLLVYMMQSLRQIPLPEMVAVMLSYEDACLAVANGLASVIGAAFLYRQFLEETSVHGEDDPDKNILVRTGMRFRSSGSYVKERKLIPAFLLVCFFAASVAVTMNMVVTLISLTSDSYTEVRQIQYSVPILVGILLYGVVSPVVEEIIFRGVTYHRTRQFFSARIAMILVAFMFGAFHGNIVQGIYAFLLGILITLAYQWTGSFWGAILFHASANLSIYCLSVSPLGKANFVTPLNCVFFATISIFAGILLYKCCKRK